MKLTDGLDGIGTAAPAHDGDSGVLLVGMHFKANFVSSSPERGQHLLDRGGIRVSAGQS